MKRMSFILKLCCTDVKCFEGVQTHLKKKLTFECLRPKGHLNKKIECWVRKVHQKARNAFISAKLFSDKVKITWVNCYV